MSGFTPHQVEAIRARGNVLVMAGAGTGKTHTLVERCLSLLLDPVANTGLDRILMVTFTEAAAAEMRHRIRLSLEKTLQSQRDAVTPDNDVIQRLEEQLALLDTARIGTLHGFCLRLIREHFAELDIDPQLNVLDPGAARLLLEETLDGILERHYRGPSETSEQLRAFIRLYGRGQDGRVREQVRKLHAYSQTLPSPARWLAEQEAQFQQDKPLHWYPMWRDSVRNLGRWQALVDSYSDAHPGAASVAAALRELAQATDDQLVTGLDALHASFEWPKAKKGEGDLNKQVKGALKPLSEEAAMLRGFAPGPDADPLAQDWEWVRHGLRSVISTTREFSESFRNAKRELAAVDFQDIEQLTLSLLWNEDRTSPSAVAAACRELFDFVFVDEYQDINPAQDLILQALSRDGEQANRFLVGDVKQSIYRFRLANPAIFQDYASQWKNGANNGRAIALSDNFRSREAILEFVNSAFTLLMRRDVGGVEYDADAALRFGNAEGRKPLATDSPRVELQLFVTGLDTVAPDEDEGNTASSETLEELSNAERESRWIAARLAALKQSGHDIWDQKQGVFRHADWGDMVILLRSPSSKAEVYAKEFARQGIPFQAPRGGFYSSIEIADLLALLQVLDNPLQDIPLLGVLRSPFVGLSLTELATARQTVPKGQFWFALNRSSAGNPRIDAFLKRYHRWRRRLRHAPLSECLETLLQETHYEAILHTADRPAQRLANLRQLLSLMRQFDQFNREGLFRFLRFVTAQQDAEQEPEGAALEGGNAVRLLSIHQSKGLEFPVVVLGDLGKPFNQDDLRGQLLLDEKLGLCAKVFAPGATQSYESIPYWLAKQHQKRELLGEELRLLYVAMTRARDTLILTGTTSAKAAHEHWPATADNLGSTEFIAKGRHYLAWLGPWIGTLTGRNDWATAAGGECPLLRWNIADVAAAIETTGSSAAVAEPVDADFDDATIAALRTRLDWNYRSQSCIHIAAKTSVSLWRRKLREESDEESTAPWATKARAKAKRTADETSSLTAAEIGTAHHAFMEMVSLECVETSGGVLGEVQRLEQAGVLSGPEVKALDLPALTAFWGSGLGQRIVKEKAAVHRELPFTARFGRSDLAADQLPSSVASLTDGDFVVVQGVIDLAVILPDAIWIVDFKTDHFAAKAKESKLAEYRPQIALYASALERIYCRPVTERWLHFLALKESVLL